jgi:hypothetical protein
VGHADAVKQVTVRFSKHLKSHRKLN